MLDSTNITEHIPTKELRELFQSQIADFCSEDTLEQLIQLSHQIIHKAVLQPRHTWSKPIWVLQGETQIYIVHETGIEEPIAKVKTQHPQETAEQVIRNISQEQVRVVPRRYKGSNEHLP